MTLTPILIFGVLVSIFVWTYRIRTTWMERIWLISSCLVLSISFQLVFDGMEFLFYLIVGVLLVVMSYIDMKEQSVYDVHNLALIVLGVSYNLYVENVASSIIGVLVAILMTALIKLFGLIRYRQFKELDYGFGNGDVFLLIALGTVVGIKIPHVLFWGCLTAAAWAIIRAIIQRKKIVNEFVPLVPFITIGTMITILFY